MTKVQSQRCIGYQRLTGARGLASVIETVWEDGRVTYSLTYSDLNGRNQHTIDTASKPYIDIPAESEVAG